jgi:WD40 repeat protein
MPNSKRTEKSSKRARIVSSTQGDLHLSPPTKGKDKAKLSTKPETTLPTSFKVIAGSYEKLLYGLDGSVSPNEDNDGYKFDLKPTFIFPAHASCIKAVAASPNGGKWLATGSADEVIKVWDLRRKKEIGGLMHHEGAFMFSAYFVSHANGRGRVHNTTSFPLPLAPPLGIRRRFIMPVPCTRLGRASYPQRSQRTRQFYGGASVK